jgi:uncharacterized protein YcbK (DUF882 family)
VAIAFVASPGRAAGIEAKAPSLPTKTPPAKPHSVPKRLPTSPAKASSSVPNGYLASVSGWHDKHAGLTAPRDPSGRVLLRFVALNTRESETLAPQPGTYERVHDEAHGGARFAPSDLERAAHILRDPRTGDSFPMDPRLLGLAYDVETHFEAPELRIISGYRTPKPGGRSNHGKGRAIDLVVPGASDEEVAAYVRGIGFVGVGVYPTSGFVHVDLRERSYFWVDTSGPGKARRERGILGELARKSDEAAREQGRVAIGPFQIGTDVEAARATLTHPHTPAKANANGPVSEKPQNERDPQPQPQLEGADLDDDE